MWDLDKAAGDKEAAKAAGDLGDLGGLGGLGDLGGIPPRTRLSLLTDELPFFAGS